MTEQIETPTPSKPKTETPAGMTAIRPKNVVGLDYENGNLILLAGNFGDGHDETLKILDKNGEVTRQLFPQAATFPNGEIFLIDPTHSYRLKVDPNDDVGKILITSQGRRKIEQNITIADRVPEKYKNEYCIMTGKTLLFHSSDKQQAMKAMKNPEFKEFSIEMYMPELY